jgi:3-keto steroid reductase
MFLSPAPTGRSFHLAGLSLTNFPVDSGLGLGICRQLIDEFIRKKPLTADLTLIFTTRDAEKGSDTLETLEKHLSTYGTSFVAKRFTKRIHLRPENVELTNLLSVRALYRHLLRSNIPKLDAIILNAGIGGWSGINWSKAVYQVLTDLISSVTWPEFKLSPVGRLTKPQLAPPGGTQDASEPPLGEVFCANVFGHYMLAHGLMPLLRSCDTQSPGKIIWISSVEVSGKDFNPDDLQGLTSDNAYGQSKRLTDLMALTAADQPATAKMVDLYCETQHKEGANGPFSGSSKPSIYVTHPGICATSIVPLLLPLYLAMLLAFYLARWAGSPWHSITVETGACAPVWLALSPEDDAAGIVGDKGLRRAKWGSATDRWGSPRAVETEVEGWGLDGSGTPIEWWGDGSWGRMRGAKDATREDVENFVEEGALVWRQMEQLRVEWEAILDEHERERAETQR